MIALVGGIPDNNPDDLDGPFCNEPYNSDLENIVDGAPKVCYFGTVEDNIKGCTKEIYQHTGFKNDTPYVTLGLKCTAHNEDTDLSSCCRISYSMTHTFWERETFDDGTMMWTSPTGLQFEFGVDESSEKPTAAFFDTYSREPLEITSIIYAKKESTSYASANQEKRIVSAVAHIPFEELGVEQLSVRAVQTITEFADEHHHYRRRHTIRGCEETNVDVSNGLLWNTTHKHWKTINDAIDTPWEKRSGRAVWDLSEDTGIVTDTTQALNVMMQVKLGQYNLKDEEITIPTDLLPKIIDEETRVEKIRLEVIFPTKIGTEIAKSTKSHTYTMEDNNKPADGNNSNPVPEFVKKIGTLKLWKTKGEKDFLVRENAAKSPFSLCALSIFFVAF